MRRRRRRWTPTDALAQRKRNERDAAKGILPSACEHCGGRELWEHNREQYPSGSWISSYRCVDCGKLTHAATPAGLRFGKSLALKRKTKRGER